MVEVTTNKYVTVCAAGVLTLEAQEVRYLSRYIQVNFSVP